ncbi:MAG: glycosyl transferase family 1, partial [Chitinophagaceae bacterium]
MKARKKLLIMIDWFEPGFKAGGPIRSIASMVHNLKDLYDIYVLTTDRDLNSTEPYPGIPTDKWIDKDGFHVNYLSPAGLKYRNIARIMTEIAPATIYLNSMFSLPFTIYPLVARRSRLAP